MTDKKLEQFETSPITPVFEQRYANQTITLGRFKASFPKLDKVGDKPRNAKAVLHFRRGDSLEFVINEPNSFFKYTSLANEPPTELVLNTLRMSIQAFFRTTALNSVTFSPSQAPLQIFPATELIERVTFHLLNWPAFLGPTDYVLKTGSEPFCSMQRLGKVILEMGNWRIAVCALPRTDELLKSLDKHGGYVITHAGEIRNAVNSTFSSQSLNELIFCLKHYFSFALGRWTAPALVVGFDSSEQRVFEQWGLHKTAHGRWEGSHTWFDYHHSELLSGASNGFFKLWANPTWNQTIREAVYWYIAANSGARTGGASIGVDASLLLSQTALELLAWTYCVMDQKIASKNKFSKGGLNAASKIRMVISSLGLSSSIPKHYSALASLAKSGQDALDVITAMRNGLVHPDATRQKQEGAYYQAWQLSLQYIELILLRLCGHSGKYANRIVKRWAGQIENLPWNPA